VGTTNRVKKSRGGGKRGGNIRKILFSERERAARIPAVLEEGSIDLLGESDRTVYDIRGGSFSEAFWKGHTPLVSLGAPEGKKE